MDVSLQAQVTAHAHRMGAVQAVHVETLIHEGDGLVLVMNMSF